MKYQELIKSGKKVTLGSIVDALDAGEYDVLYFSSEAQIARLIDAGKIDEDYSSLHFMYLEEMAFMMGEQR